MICIMKKKFMRLMISCGLCFLSGNVFASVSLTQSFEEANVVGPIYFGSSISIAGDVNNDGYDDVIVGARGYNSNTGRTYVYYGGSSMDNTADVIMTGGAHDSFGYSVSGAGDVNNDGYDDVIIGEHDYSTSIGRTYIYYGGSSMDNTADVVMTGEGTHNCFGWSVSGAGDVNSDGYDDVIVGASGYGLNNNGRTYIYYGGSPMDTTADVVMTGEVAGDYFGSSVSNAGDVNNDGFGDVIVGAWESSYYGFRTGRAYVYYGGSPMDTTADVVMTGEVAGDYFGHSVSGAGDVNDDGYDDVVVGAWGYNSEVGRGYVYFGSSSMNNTADVVIVGESESNFFGYSVSDAGDVNNDGYDDIVVGECAYNTCTGRAYVYYGGSSIDSTADVIMVGEDVENYFGFSVSGGGDVNNDGYDDVIVGAYKYDLDRGRAYVYCGSSSMDNTADVVMTSKGESNYFGHSVSDAGDVNNDGYDDIIIGAYGYNTSTGRTYVYYGGFSMDNTADVIMTGEATGDHFGNFVSSAGDVNNDGFDDVIVASNGRANVYYGGSSMDNTVDINIILTGCSSASGAGDVNNDGFDDVVVGARGYNSNTGRTYVYYGGSSMDNTADVMMTGESTGDFFGSSVSGAGDVNNDGYDDVIVGASYYGAYDDGRAYVYYGGSSMDSTVDVTMTPGWGVGWAGHFGCSVSGAGDVNNDGYDDVIVGASAMNYYQGRACIYFGESAMDDTADVVMGGEDVDNEFGVSVSDAGDVNNDGYDDVIVGARIFSYYGPCTSRAYIYFGGSSMDNVADETMVGEGMDDYFGYSVSGAGDVNGDGYDEVIVGAYRYGANDNGKAYVYTVSAQAQLPDLECDPASLAIDPVSVQPGNTFTISGVVENSGSVSTGVGFNVNIYLCPDMDVLNYSSSYFLGSFILSALGPGLNTSFNETVTVPLYAQSGTYYAWVSLDPLGAVIENNEVNNKESCSTPLVIVPMITASGIPQSLLPTIDGQLNDPVWSYLDEDSLLYGGVPVDWGATWSSFADNLVTYQVCWSQNTNKLYLAVNVQDDVRGTPDNGAGSSLYAPHLDDAVEFFTDGDTSGGPYVYQQAQQWFVTTENDLNLHNYPSDGSHLYDRSDVQTAVQLGTGGNWICEVEITVYDTFPSQVKILQEGDAIGWDIWYDDSDDETYSDPYYLRDHHTGWFYGGPSYLNADYLGIMVLGSEIPGSGVEPEEVDQVVIHFHVGQNYPNPFNAQTRIFYTIPEPSKVTVQIFNIQGKAVRTLLDSQLQAGNCSILWDGLDNTNESAPSGVYVFQIEVLSLTSKHFVDTKKMILLR